MEPRRRGGAEQLLIHPSPRLCGSAVQSSSLLLQMPISPAIRIDNVEHTYGDRLALRDLSLAIEPQEIFAFLGPNGGGKTTLFRLLSTLIPLKRGDIKVLGQSVRTEAAAVRCLIGVVFQAPSLDKKLTVAENVRCQGQLYGLSGRTLTERQAEMLDRFRLADRASDRVETLSGGLRRRVELAKGLLHKPRLLLLDEPSSGLDPLARADLWAYLEQVRNEDGVTVVLTSHLLEEADRADRIAILDRGRLVALGAPDELRATVGGDSITIQTAEPPRLATAIRERFDCPAEVVGDDVRLERADGHQWIARLVEAFPGQIDSVRLGKPSLEDVFIDRTGRRFEEQVGGRQ
jgi:ABC-2 type transport system ATP-binding protein